ncbi:unnamed protein product [Paramecium sonneborni]|uniref:Uncharacterized protein n=1 Tax=Paramecium sonneborni TaxID=65129 RepID=A0A8S1RHJ9_9CILI|nr:unnamed protein product [Paramecium sonneborni]
MNINKQKKTINTPPQLIGSAPFYLGPHHPPLPAAKTLHYPLPNDRHLKPKLLNIHIEQSVPMIVFSDMGVGIEDMGWGGWKAEEGELDPWDEALLNDDVMKLEQLDKQSK